MSDLTRADRALVHRRDQHRCLRCGGRPATIQHRRAKGMGGIGPTGPRLTPADAVLLCIRCNRGAEAELQQEALERGWKVQRSSPVPSTEVPYFDALSGNWWLPDALGGRAWTDAETAEAMIRVSVADR
jgi:hypothetical protein